ncbi:MAG: homocysteine biosynthesis protein [Bacillota bacterium]
MSYKSFDEINQRIKEKKAVVVTAEEMKAIVAESGPREAAAKIDVVTTATFGPMCSTGAFLNFGHSEPPIRMSKVWLNDVPAYAGIAAVDAFIGATELSETRGFDYGGAHVIEDLVAGKKVKLRATSYGTDCYPLKEIETYVDKESLNQAYMFNPRNCYQNYGAAANTSDRTIYTYMGTLLPHVGNVNYSTSGELSPLLNDPLYRTTGVGTRIFLAGADGYVAWQGTQHNPCQARGENGVPTGSAGTLALIGDLKQMDPRFLRAAVFEKYGVTMFVGAGIPIPILDEDMAACTGVRNKDIYTSIYDYSVPSRSRPVLRKVSYEELRSGSVSVGGREVPTAPLSSLKVAREIAGVLRDRISRGDFLLQEPVMPLPRDTRPKPLEVVSGDGEVAR